MESYRSPKFVERYEDVVFELETPLDTTVANTRSQKKQGYRFVADNSGEITPCDWYNSRLSISFKVNKLADGANIAEMTIMVSLIRFIVSSRILI